MSSINPSTSVRVSDLKTSLRGSRLINFQYNVTDMIDKMMADYEFILERKGKHDDMVLEIFTTLFSGKTEIFSSLIQRRKDD